MDVNNTVLHGGSLQISTEVIAKIATLAALEIEGVREVGLKGQSVKGLLAKGGLQKPVQVQMQDGVAEITLSILVLYGTKVNAVGKQIQKNVKSAVQNMTGITVSRVNVVVSGLADAPAEEPSEPEVL